MRTELGSAGALIGALLLGSSGCVGASIAPDVALVREMTHAEDLSAFHHLAVDPTIDGEVRRLLAEPLDPDTAVRIAVLNNRELRATLREMGIARGQLIQAGLIPNPLFEIELLPERNTEVEFRVEYEITQALFAPARARVARANLEAARLRAARAVVDTGVRVRGVYFALQGAEQRLHVGQRLLDAFAASRDAARALFEAGNIPEVDLAVQEAAFERARVVVARMELEVAERREAMQRLLGLFGDETRWELAGKLPDLPEAPGLEDGFESRVIERSFELSEIRHRLEALARRVGLTRRAGATPDVAFDVHALYGRPDVPRAETDDLVRFGAGVSFTAPVFDRQQGLVRAYAAEFDALLERYHGVAIATRSAVRELRSRLVSAHARARQYIEVIVPAQRRVTEESLRQYNAMQLGVFELLAARREQLNAELDAVEALREYWTASAGMEAALAGGGAIASPPGAAAGSPGIGSPEAGGH